MRHRKLFPALTSTNQSADCSELCDPACPYNCYPYSDYYFLPPPPPPPPPPVLSEGHHISPYVFVIVSVVAALFLLLSYYVIIAKSFPTWCSWRNNRQQQPQGENTDEEFLDENRVDHPIWFITTVGLQQSIINSITICRYKKGEGLIEGTECSVCLNEFQQDETLRLLPKCNHAFHISCIDTWLRSHTNCPLCRSHIVNDAIVSLPLVAVNQNPGNPSTIGSTRMENSATPHETNLNRERYEVGENRAGVEDAGEIVQVTEERIIKDDVSSNVNGDFRVPCDSCNHNSELVKNTVPVLKRSLSMDSMTSATMCIGLADHSPFESDRSSVDQIMSTERTDSNVGLDRNGGCSSSSRHTSSSSIAQCLHKSPVPMKRSFSCAGRFFSSRQNRSLNSILPL